MELDGSSGASDVTVASFAYGKDLGGLFLRHWPYMDAILIRCDGVTAIHRHGLQVGCQAWPI